jgi:hypothetical protein
MLCTVSRPFEAHLYKHGYHQASAVNHAPSTPQRPSPTRHTSYTIEERPLHRQKSTSTHQSTPSGATIANVESLGLSVGLPSATLYAPSPVCSLGRGSFTSGAAPPAIPAAYASPPQASSFGPPLPIFHPSVSHQSLTRPPRISGSFSSSATVPMIITPQYSASTWRAVHPGNLPLSLPASRSYPNLRGSYNAHHNRYSRSSVSLTKPHRLSTTTPPDSVTWSSKSGSTGPEGTDGQPSSEENKDLRASAHEIAFSILNGTPIPGTTRQKTWEKSHMRTASAPDAISGAQQLQHLDRMAMGWKPELVQQSVSRGKYALPGTQPTHFKIPRKPVRSASAEFLGRVGIESSQDSNDINLRKELDLNFHRRAKITQDVPVRRLRSAEQMGSLGVADTEKASSQDFRQPVTRILHSDPEGRKKRIVINKPLPKAAAS